MLHAREDYQRIQDPEGKIPDNEPVFLLRGQDETAAEVVKFWADLNEKRGGDPELIQRARAQVEKMEDWATKKTADL